MIIRRRWPLYVIASPAAVAIWSGWVGLGSMCGFGPVHLLPGIADSFVINSAITLPVGVEAYGAYALRHWLDPATPEPARKFARRSSVGALLLGMSGQVIYHLLAAAHWSRAPWPIVTLVACIPVVSLGFGAALAHLLHTAAWPTSPWPRPAPVLSEPEQVPAAAEPEPVPETFTEPPDDSPEPAPARRPRPVTAQVPGGARQAAIRALRDQPDLTLAQLAAAIGKSKTTAVRVRKQALAEIANGNGDGSTD